MKLDSPTDFTAVTTALTQLFGLPYADTSMPRCLLISIQPHHLARLRLALANLDCECHATSSVNEALSLLTVTAFDVIVLDASQANAFYQSESAVSACPHLLITENEKEEWHRDSPAAAAKLLTVSDSLSAWRTALAHCLNTARLQRAYRALSCKLDDSERLYRYLVQNTCDLIFLLDAEGAFTFLNECAGTMLGYRGNELIGRHFSTVVHPDDVERARYIFNEKRARNRINRQAEVRFRCAPDQRAGRRPPQEKWVTIDFRTTAVYGPTDGGPTTYRGTYGLGRDVTALRLAEEQLAHQTYHDALTDLPNRLLFRHHAELALADAGRNAHQLAMLCLDLDRFKLINDTLGHAHGDLLIQLVATRLRDTLPPELALSRLSGDEFMVMMPRVQDKAAVAQLAARILELLQEPFDLQGHEVHISASIGSALYPEDGTTIDELIARAGIATVHMKALGKNGHSVFDGSMLAAAHRRVSLEQSLRRALENDELEMYYQPQVDVFHDHLVGVEALIRWHHPERGLLSAAEFLPAMEDSSLMQALSDWMVDAVCRDIAAWNRHAPTTIQVGINLSPHYLDRGNFSEVLQAALLAHGVRPDQIEVEITEETGMRDVGRALSQLNKLHALGVRIAIDDFGTGYSSLSYLHRFPVHTLKIDKSFIKIIDDEEGNFPVVLAIISIARGLGMHLVAEGVETEVQRRYLRRVGCHVMQGYLFHPPLPSRCLPALLHTKKVMCA